jgi:hypothetical protein
MPFFFATSAMWSARRHSARSLATARFIVVREGTSECGISPPTVQVGSGLRPGSRCSVSAIQTAIAEEITNKISINDFMTVRINDQQASGVSAPTSTLYPEGGQASRASQPS